MSNHYHLLVETPSISGRDEVAAMGLIPQRYNPPQLHAIVPGTLQGGVAGLGNKEPYFKVVSHLIHPQSGSGEVDSVGKNAKFRWSSYPLYLRTGPKPAERTVWGA